MGNIIDDWCDSVSSDPDYSNRVADFKRNKDYFDKKLTKGDYFHICKCCGMPEFANYSNKEELIGSQLCFYCDLWSSRMKDKSFLIISGKFYKDGGHKPKEESKYLGFGGALHGIRMLDGSREWETNNLWYGGECPKAFKPVDNAEFLNAGHRNGSVVTVR